MKVSELKQILKEIYHEDSVIFEIVLSAGNQYVCSKEFLSIKEAISYAKLKVSEYLWYKMPVAELILKYFEDDKTDKVTVMKLAQYRYNEAAFDSNIEVVEIIYKHSIVLFNRLLATE